MSFDPKRYPKNWKSEVVPAIRARSGDRCECTGQCGLHRFTGGPRRCTEINGAPARFARGRIVLTAAHLCKCEPKCGNLEHLRHMCQRCHLRIDVTHHLANRRRRMECETGQRRLIER